MAMYYFIPGYTPPWPLLTEKVSSILEKTNPQSEKKKLNSVMIRALNV